MEIKVGEIVKISISLIEADPNQPRDAYEKGSPAYIEHIAKLKESIKAAGQDEPIHVRKHPSKEGMFMVVNGETRFIAVKSLGRTEIPCILKEYKNEDEVWLAQTRSNAQRKGLNCLTDLRNYQAAAIKGEGLLKQMCQQNGEKVGAVREKIKILALPENLLILWEKKQVTEETCQYILKQDMPLSWFEELIPLITAKTTKESKRKITAFVATKQQKSVFHDAIGLDSSDNSQETVIFKRDNSSDYKKSLNNILSQYESALKIMKDIAPKGKILGDACGKMRGGGGVKKGKGKNNQEVGYNYALNTLKEMINICTKLQNDIGVIAASSEIKTELKKAA